MGKKYYKVVNTYYNNYQGAYDYAIQEVDANKINPKDLFVFETKEEAIECKQCLEYERGC